MEPDPADTWRGGGVLRQGGAHCQPRIQKEACESRTASSAFLAPSGFSPGHLLLFQAGRSLGRVLRLCEPRSRDAWERPGPCSPGGCADASACREQGRGQKERPSQTPVIQTSHPACLSAGEVDSQVTDCREALRLPPTLSELRTLHCPSLWGTGRLTCEQGQSGALTRANTFWPSAPFRLDFC